MKECPKCNTMIEDDACFCHECGTKQEIEEVEAQAGGTICRRKVLRSLWKSHRGR